MIRFLERRKREVQKIRQYAQSLCAALKQNVKAQEINLAKVSDLVLFFTASIDDCNGGVMSIASLAATSRKLLPSATVLMTTYPGEPTVIKNETFPNSETIIRFSLICRLARPKKLIIHIPEMDADGFYGMLSPAQREWIRAIPDCQINILNQNILYMRPREDWAKLFELTKKVSQTTAHDRYTSQEMCDKYGIPLHLFSTHLDKSLWPWKSFAEKEKIIALSPDVNEFVEPLKRRIRDELPDYRVVTIRSLTFPDYLDLISRARVVISMGEGFDWYFMQPADVGSVGIAVFNEDFFPDDSWRMLQNVYGSYAELIDELPRDVRRFESDKTVYDQVILQCRSKIEKVYDENAFCTRLSRFYRGEYDFYPLLGDSDEHK